MGEKIAANTLVGTARPDAQETHSSGGRLNYLDGWRAIAIFGVFADHFATPRFFNTGRLGVELFFVLSGRLMAQILFVEGMSLGPFYYRRFARVWPASSIFLVLLAIAGVAFAAVRIGGAYFLTGITFTYNYFAAFGHRALPIDHLWSLCIEEHTYLFLGLLALLSRRFPKILWPILLITIGLSLADGIISTAVLHQDYYMAYWRTDTRMASITIGTAAFLACQTGRFKVTGYWPLVLIIVGVVANANQVPDFMKYTLGTACLAIGLSNIEADTTKLKSVLATPALVYIGLISYSLYLWQQPFSVTKSHSVVLRFLPLVPAILCGLFSFYVIENPIRRWLNRNAPAWARKPANPVNVDSAKPYVA